MNTIIDQLRTFYFANPTLGTRILESIAVVLLLWLIRRLIVRFVVDRIEDHDQIYLWKKGTEYSAIGIGALAIGGIWFSAFDNASTFLGLLSAGIAIALQDPLVNFVGWIYILLRNPFEVGDRIEVDGLETAGDVVDIKLFSFSLLEIGNWVDADQSTGRILHVPNRKVFQHVIANYTSGVPHIWNEIPVMLTFESDWQIAKRALREIAKRHSLAPKAAEIAEIKQAAKKNNLKYPRLTPVVYTKVTHSGVVLTLRYLCRPRQRRNSEQAIWEEILLRFAEEKEVDFAYDTTRIFYHPVEGKTLLTDHSEVAQPRNHLYMGDRQPNNGITE